MEHSDLKSASLDAAGASRLKRARDELGTDSADKQPALESARKRSHQEQHSDVTVPIAYSGTEPTPSPAEVGGSGETSSGISTPPSPVKNAAELETVRQRDDFCRILAAAAADVAGKRAEIGTGANGTMGEVKKCEVCGTEDRRYCCPRCGKLTCSLPCCKQHKKNDPCNGQRDKVAFVGLKEFTDLQLRSDFNFLEDALRCMDGGRRELSRSKPGIINPGGRGRGGRGRGRGRGRGGGRGGRGETQAEGVGAVIGEQMEGGALGLLAGQNGDWLKGRSAKQQRLVKEAAMRGTRLLLMPDGMARSRSNTTAVINKKQQIGGGGNRGRGRNNRHSTSGRGGRGAGRGHVESVPGRGPARAPPGTDKTGSTGCTEGQGRQGHGSDVPGLLSKSNGTLDVIKMEHGAVDAGAEAVNESSNSSVVNCSSEAQPDSVKQVHLQEEPREAAEQAMQSTELAKQAKGISSTTSATTPDTNSDATPMPAQLPGKGASGIAVSTANYNGPAAKQEHQAAPENATKSPVKTLEKWRSLSPPVAASSKELLQMEGRGMNAKGKGAGVKVGGGAKTSNVAWRVEWVFSGVSAGSSQEGDGLRVSDDAVPEERTLHEALARHLEPREGNAPLRHRLRKFSKPWTAMARSFATLALASVQSESASSLGSMPNRESSVAGGPIVSGTSFTIGLLRTTTSTAVGQGPRKLARVDGPGECSANAGLRLFLQRVPCTARRPMYWEIYPGDTLGSALGGKTVIEFPTIYVALSDGDASRFVTLISDLSDESTGFDRAIVEGAVGSRKIAVGSPGPVKDQMEDDQEDSSSGEDASSSESDSGSGSGSDSDGSDDADDREQKEVEQKLGESAQGRS